MKHEYCWYYFCFTNLFIYLDQYCHLWLHVKVLCVCHVGAKKPHDKLNWAQRHARPTTKVRCGSHFVKNSSDKGQSTIDGWFGHSYCLPTYMPKTMHTIDVTIPNPHLICKLPDVKIMVIAEWDSMNLQCYNQAEPRPTKALHYTDACQ